MEKQIKLIVQFPTDCPTEDLSDYLINAIEGYSTETGYMGNNFGYSEPFVKFINVEDLFEDHNDSSITDILQINKELLEISTKAGRRCAYDLAHSGDMIPGEVGQSIRERAENWLTVFNPANGVKDYRNILHKEIFNLEMEMNKYKERLKENNIDYSDIEMWPRI